MKTIRLFGRDSKVVSKLGCYRITAMAVTALLVMSILSPFSAKALAAPPLFKVSGNSLVDQNGASIRTLGVNRAGTEFACIQGWGFFDGPSDDASIVVMKSWNINTVRVPLNQDCWLAIKGAPAAFSGTAYQDAIKGYVGRLNAAGIGVILDLHWSGAGTTKATGQQLMADADYSPAFWTSVATAFKTNQSVIFDLFNEPHGISWDCWKNGCTTSEGWQSAGMQSLVNAVRQTGATQPLLLGGLEWANDLSQWNQYMPADPLNALVAGLHLYNFNACVSETCWNEKILPVAAKVPVVTGELGSNDCGTSFINSYFKWADTNKVSYLGWTWNTWNCNSGPALISSYDGTPTAFGAGFKTQLGLATAPPTTVTPTPPANSTAPVVTLAAPNGSVTTAVAGSQIASSVNVSTVNPAAGLLVDIEVYNSSGVKVAQQYFENQSLSSTAKLYQVLWTPTQTGTYTVRAGVFSAGWATNYAWNNSLYTINVTSSPVPVSTKPVRRK